MGLPWWFAEGDTRSKSDFRRLTLEFVTWSAGTDSGTVCRVLRMLADIVGQPVSLQPQTLLQRYVDAPSSPLTSVTKEGQRRSARGINRPACRRALHPRRSPSALFGALTARERYCPVRQRRNLER